MEDKISITVLTVILIIVTLLLTSFVIYKIVKPNNVSQEYSKSQISQKVNNKTNQQNGNNSDDSNQESKKKKKMNIASDYDEYSKTIDDESLHESNNDNYQLVNFLKNIICENKGNIKKSIKTYQEEGL